VDVFELREQLIADYRRYVTSFMAIRDTRIKERVQTSLNEEHLWPESRIALNPAFEPGGWIDDLVTEGLLHPSCSDVFRVGKTSANPLGERMRLHQHQVDAIHAARDGGNYVLTTGTGSGKSLAYIVPVVDHVLRVGAGTGVKAIVVYPMNALANSQYQELEKFLSPGFGGTSPVKFQVYTGQEREDTREEIRKNPPDVILTNYVMLELILTRVRDQKLIGAARDLRFLVLDELHTYRGRQGADVALLVRRLREATGAQHLQCVGTSATLSTEGTQAQQRSAVARVASQIFGSTVHPEAIIGETLRRATRPLDHSDDAVRRNLRERVEAASPSAAVLDYKSFVEDPLSSWIETTFGVEEVQGRLVRAAAKTIDGPDGGAAELAEITGIERERCRDAIRWQLLSGYGAVHPETGFPAFAFRLHQFISKGDTVFASPENEDVRYLTVNGQRFVPGHRDRVLLPLSFCRHCGQEYYTVHRVMDGNGVVHLVPRNLDDRAADGEHSPGFLYVSTDAPWPDGELDALDRLPEDWLEETGAGAKVKSSHKRLLPSSVRVDSRGWLEAAGTSGVRAWWIPAPFRLCLLCGVAYDGRFRRDFTKLTTLGSEGRSTATTVLSASAVRWLRMASDLSPQARKLLSFTDNRQDASLQAGHFNDFVQVGLLRAALYRAVSSSGDEGLEHEQITEAVFRTLGLPFYHYAVNPDLEFHARRDTERVLRDVLGYLLYLDLRRGWRVTAPNLEQCGLLAIEYQSLQEVTAADYVWAEKHPALASATAKERYKIATTLLDYLRRELAIDVDYLDPGFQEKLVQRSSQRLVGPWAIDEVGQLEYSRAVLPRSRRPGDHRGFNYLSARSGFGRYLRRASTFASYDSPLKLADTEEIIRDLFEGLARGGLVEEAEVGGDGTPGYRVPASAMVWKAGDGTNPYRDPVRMPSASSVDLGPNDFFVELYTNLARDLVGVEAREHTAQVRAEFRQERERMFRTGQLPVLYCSPTMELGVDIAELNVVNMRNVPPTPANYAQRSGRAGRSGQPALVFTYCSAGSPHDQYYFARPQLMVSGQVSPPRIDLANEDLVRSHAQAIWLASAELHLGGSLTDVLDVREGADGAPIQQHVMDSLNDPNARRAARDRATSVLADIHPLLTESSWWSESWLDDVLNAVPNEFARATERWRGLYRAALSQFDRANTLIKSPATSVAERNQAKDLRRQAEAQLNLLINDADTNTLSDFYSYRYFASEGFLPGYSFPRLPLSAFIPGSRGGRDDGEYVSRPRFLAISEFGPNALVYHEGARYQISRVILSVTEQLDESGDPVLTSRAKRCHLCGYVHPIDSSNAQDLCERCKATLGAPLGNLFRLQNVATRRRDRIISDEEERQRQGFELYTALRFAVRNGRLSVQTAELNSAGESLGALTYGDTATIWRINVGLRRRADKARLGFMLDVDTGRWSPERDEESDGSDESPTGPRLRRVIPYVEDTRNCLVFEPAQRLDAEAMASLEAALKSAILVEYQLEEDELATEPLPSRDDRRLILLYESAEGGAGVLKRLVTEPDQLRRVARRALTLCHFDPDTGYDLAGQIQTEPCEAACYDCLMSYRNQLDHQLLDRKQVVSELMSIRDATVVPGTGPAAAGEHLTGLVSQADSTLEESWLDYLRERGHVLPDRGQTYFEDAKTRPDFVYDDKYVAVYIDGPVHEYPERQVRDVAATEAMRDLGWRVVRFGYRDDWASITDAFKDVFGVGK
jgi:ATP-dependent helicase YprA (DUF1998 family)